MADRFSGEIRPVGRTDLADCWRPGCPVGPDQLRLVMAAHRDFEGGVREGRLVVHREVAGAILRVMKRLFEAGFPIERMDPVRAFRGDDVASMAANNSSAFNCREIRGRPGVWSRHAYGLAVDLNPVQNPFVTDEGEVLPPQARRYLDRTLDEPGMIHAGDEVVRAFGEIGWSWGGTWSPNPDYQHFSASGT